MFRSLIKCRNQQFGECRGKRRAKSRSIGPGHCVFLDALAKFHEKVEFEWNLSTASIFFLIYKRPLFVSLINKRPLFV